MPYGLVVAVVQLSDDGSVVQAVGDVTLLPRMTWDEDNAGEYMSKAVELLESEMAWCDIRELPEGMEI